MQAPLPADEADRLAVLHDMEILDSAPEQDFDDIVALASTVCGVPMSLVSLVDDSRQWFKARIGTEVTETSRDVSFCAHAILGRDLLVVSDTRLDDRFADNPAVSADPGIRFYAGAPLVTTDGYALGTLCVVDAAPRRLSLDQLRALRALARQVTAQLELRRYAVTLARTTTRLRELEHHKERLVDLVSRLQVPLRQATGLLDTFAAGGPPDPALLTAMRATATGHGPALHELIDHLLSVADTGGSAGDSLQMREVDLTRIAQRAVEAVRPIAATKSIWILNQAGGPALPVIADPVRLEMVLMHLLFAAVKYTPAGGRVRVATDAESGPTVRLDDLDLPDGVRPELFNHLYYGALVQPADLVGPDRGLAVAKQILDAHHATMALSDRPGDGTSLHLVFPPPYAPSAPAPTATGAGVGAATEVG